jgi:carboxymethylenebutenolidase
MTTTIDYYFAPQSPWTYLGHRRLWDIARAAGARINVRPVDLGARALTKRSPQRQAYRRRELQRFSDWLQVPLNPEPRYFPVSGDDAARLIIAVDLADGSDAAMRIALAVMQAVWAQERNIAEEATLAALLAESELPAARLDEAHSQAVQVRYEADSQQALDAGVFSDPSYVIDGDIFWGQDRLDFVERLLRPHA